MFQLFYIGIPAVTIIAALIGSSFTSDAISSGWYESIAKPTWTPAGTIIGTVWTIIYVLATISALLWYSAPHGKTFSTILVLFLTNAVLNAGWSYLFFGAKMLGPAVIECALLALTIVGLICLLWPISKTAAYLLVPYVLWVSFATYLTYSIWALNR